MTRLCLAVPCFNEVDRLDVKSFVRFLELEPEVSFIFVDDGSTDATRSILHEIERNVPDRVDVIGLARNGGKAAAVWTGVNAALAAQFEYVGYWDADLATPLTAIPEFAGVLEADATLEMVFGARVKLLGRVIERRRVRHYLGRVAATLVAASLRLAIYDSQCGAKLFRASALTRELFAGPFLSRWLFDVEILARLVRLHRLGRARPPAELIYELPLTEWTDKPGSKLRIGDFARAALDLIRIRYTYGGPVFGA